MIIKRSLSGVKERFFSDGKITKKERNRQMSCLPLRCAKVGKKRTQFISFAEISRTFLPAKHQSEQHKAEKKEKNICKENPRISCHGIRGVKKKGKRTR